MSVASEEVARDNCAVSDELVQLREDKASQAQNLEALQVCTTAVTYIVICTASGLSESIICRIASLILAVSYKCKCILCCIQKHLLTCLLLVSRCHHCPCMPMQHTTALLLADACVAMCASFLCVVSFMMGALLGIHASLVGDPCLLCRTELQSSRSCTCAILINPRRSRSTTAFSRAICCSWPHQRCWLCLSRPQAFLCRAPPRPPALSQLCMRLRHYAERNRL